MELRRQQVLQIASSPERRSSICLTSAHGHKPADRSHQQAEFLLKLAQSMAHNLAARLCQVHLSARSALSGDNNFLCQAAWLMAGGFSPVAEQIEPVTDDECHALLNQAKERWRNPQPIPRWCCDGIHCSGDDPRFAGCLPEMYAVCRAFQHYGRIDPTDEWSHEFQCYDGLIIEAGSNGKNRTHQLI